MATVKKSKKKKIIIAVCAVLIIAVAAAVIAVSAKNASIPRVSLYTIGTSNIYETVSATGEVTSGSAKEYKVGTVATVKEVFVNVGDEVKQGDTLATFDTSNYDSQIQKLQESYNKAKESYNESVAAQKQAKNNLAAVQKEIAALEKEVETLKKGVADSASSYSSSMSAYVQLLSDLQEALTKLLNDAEEVNAIMSVAAEAISNALNNGISSAPELADAVAAALEQAMASGIIRDSDAVIQVVKDIISKADFSSVNTDITNSNSVKLTTAQIRLASCYVEEELYTAQASDSLVSAKKEIMDTAAESLSLLKEARNELAAGWTAAFDGTITACDIYPGEQTTLISSGITLQNLNNLVVTVSLGEYDIHKVKVGMDATVSTAYGTYTGSVISKAPVASGGSSSSILDSVGSMAGISGLSSLTDTGAGVEVQIAVDNPDEYIIIGFDAQVEIAVGDHLDIPTVPSQSLILDKTGTYVYLYNEEESTVTKTYIETGAVSVSEYEVTSGIKVGDRIVSAPQSTYEDSFEVRVSEESIADSAK